MLDSVWCVGNETTITECSNGNHVIDCKKYAFAQCEGDNVIIVV